MALTEEGFAKVERLLGM
ncbi:MAG: hypothetical protein QM757_39905 [Paludibaculum sp.]